MLTFYSSKENVLKMGHPCMCIKCSHPCRYGSGVLAEGDLKNIAAHLGKTEDEVKEEFMEEITKFNTTRLRPKLLREDGMPYGRCIFYDEVQGCRIHEVKPLECKVAMGCKPYGEELITWFDLNHFLNKDDIESLRQFKIYVEAGGKILPGAEPEKLIDKETLKKIENYDDLVIEKDWEKELGLKDDAKSMKKGDDDGDE